MCLGISFGNINKNSSYLAYIVLMTSKCEYKQLGDEVMPMEKWREFVWVGLESHPWFYAVMINRLITTG
jgi:hypothetical protein